MDQAEQEPSSETVSDFARLLKPSSPPSLDAPGITRAAQQLAEDAEALIGHWTSVEIPIAAEPLAMTEITSVAERHDKLLPTLFGSLETGRWFVVCPELDFIRHLLDPVFGGDGTVPMIDEARPVSPVEMQFAECFASRFGERVASRFNVSLEPSVDVADFAELSADLQALKMVQLTYTAQIQDQGGYILLLVSDALFRQIAPQLDTEPSVASETVTEGTEWAELIEQELRRSFVTVRATVVGPRVSLTALTDLRIGDVLETEGHPDSNVLIDVDGQPILHGQLGQAGQKIAVRVTSALSERDDVIAQLTGQDLAS